MTTDNPVYDHAKQYVAAGLSILPISSAATKDRAGTFYLRQATFLMVIPAAAGTR